MANCQCSRIHKALPDVDKGTSAARISCFNHTLMRQSFETEREQILQRPIVVDLHPSSAALRFRRGIQYRSDVTAAFHQKDVRVPLEFVTGVWKIRV